MLTTKPQRTLLNSAIIAALAGSVSIPVLAQQAPANQPDAEDKTIEVIEVTAQNRVQSVNDVPISMNVVSGEDLRDAGVTDMQTLNRVAPDFETTNDSIATKVSLRGISTESSDEAQDQSLTISIDGEYINRPRVMNATMFDIQRVEVLRGPQGTLYGRNATGGAVNIITNKPVLGEFSGDVSADVGNYNAKEFNGALNVPLGDNAAVRVAGITSKHDGYRDHPNLNMKSGDKDIQAARIGVAIEPTDNLSAYLAYETSSLDQQVPLFAAYNANSEAQADDGNGNCNTAAGWELVAVQDGNTLCTPSHTNNLAGIDPRSYDAPSTAPFGFHKVDGDARAQIEYSTDAFTVSYRGGYRDSTVDADEALHPNYIFYRNTNIKTTSHELRFSGGDDRFFWQGGVFHFDETQDVSSGLISYIGAAPYGPQGYWANTFYRPDMKSTSNAVFGQVDYPLTDTLTLVVGGRYTKDKKSAHQTNLPGGLTFDEVITLRPIDTEGAETTALLSEHNELTWTAGINYQPDSDSLYYGKISKGYKAGGFDSTGTTYEPEILYAYEAGMKTNYDTANFSGSAFYYDYKDLQVSVLLDTNKGGQVFNAGKARIFGFEGSVDTYLTDVDKVTASVNYLNAEYTDFNAAIPVQCLGGCGVTAVSQVDGELISLKGNEPSHAPNWILTFGYDHYWEMDAGTVVASIFTRWKDDYYLNAFNDDDSRQDAYMQTDANIKFTSSDDAWEVMLYVRNIEDNDVTTFYSYTAAGPDDVQLWSFAPPRTFGAKVTYRFY